MTRRVSERIWGQGSHEREPAGAVRLASLPRPVWTSRPALGGVPEWLNGAVSKTVVRVTPAPRVRIPPPPSIFTRLRRGARPELGPRCGSMSNRRAHKTQPISNWATRGAGFAAALMVMIGGFQVIEGIAAISDDKFFRKPAHYALHVNPSVWGDPSAARLGDHLDRHRPVPR